MPEPQGSEVECPTCRGRGGFTDYFGEYDECRDCNETGRVSPERKAAIEAENARIDALCEQQMRAEESGDGR